MQAKIRRIDLREAIFIGSGAAIAVPWLVIGIFFLRHLHGIQVLWGGELGGLGILLLTYGLSTAIRRHWRRRINS